ncbi:hypothetical protein [Kordiimonas aestuarii]|uniref:hypothetical protein n=1 Tax=Kordiimonas aestuarii TaxID=1005925 RepID=UPI0021CEE65C|nr:hypothetical protein [Kordiimonas aestuarii]
MMTQARAAKVKRRIILHCGAPKTGSTSLQHFFADNATALARDGAVCPPRFFRQGNVDPLHTIFTQLRAGLRRQEKLLAAGRQRLDKLFDEAGVHTVLISNESALGEPFMAVEPGFFPAHARSIELLQKLFAGYEVQVVYFIRDFESFMPSYYVQYVRMGGFLSFDEFCAHIGDHNLSWQPVLGTLGHAFGAANIHCHRSENLRLTPADTVVQAFGQFLPSLPTFVAGKYNQNLSVGPVVLSVYRGFNRLVATLVPRRYHRRLRPLMRQYVYEPIAYLSGLLTAGKARQRPAYRPTGAQATHWRAQYENDLARLQVN